MTDTNAGDLVPHDPPPPRVRRWQAVIGLVGLAAVVIATVTTVDDARERALPGPWALAAALLFHSFALIFIGRAWTALFPPDADRRALASSLYTSQLTKYMPAGGLVQAASQVALSAQTSGVGTAAVRLPVFSLCAVVAAATLACPLVFSTSLPGWGRALAGLGVLAPLLLARRLLGVVLHTARRFVRRLPDADSLPPQRSILTSYAFTLANLATYAVAFTILITDLTDVDPLLAGAALCAAWVVGYLVVPLPSGLGVREVILVAALPGLGAGPLLAASLAHRLLAIAAEAGFAGVARARIALDRRRVSA